MTFLEALVFQNFSKTIDLLPLVPFLHYKSSEIFPFKWRFSFNNLIILKFATVN